jgi:hypothetical protein
MGQCQTKENIRSVLPDNTSQEQPPESYIKNATNLTKRRIKRTRSKIIYDSIKGK